MSETKREGHIRRITNALIADEAKVGIHFTHDAVVELLELLKVQPEPKWIPCSERLPEAEEKHYWVCTDTGYQCQCRWTNINHFWTELTTEWHWHIMDTPQYSKVIAWMPLPEPYVERRTDERTD